MRGLSVCWLAEASAADGFVALVKMSTFDNVSRRGAMATSWSNLGSLCTYLSTRATASTDAAPMITSMAIWCASAISKGNVPGPVASVDHLELVHVGVGLCRSVMLKVFKDLGSLGPTN